MYITSNVANNVSKSKKVWMSYSIIKLHQRQLPLREYIDRCIVDTFPMIEPAFKDFGLMPESNSIVVCQPE